MPTPSRTWAAAVNTHHSTAQHMRVCVYSTGLSVPFLSYPHALPYACSCTPTTGTVDATGFSTIPPSPSAASTSLSPAQLR
jgi:hypothetical protein